jgi:hypothetical protein
MMFRNKHIVTMNTIKTCQNNYYLLDEIRFWVILDLFLKIKSCECGIIRHVYSKIYYINIINCHIMFM